jgi:hypothetical protein
MDETIFDSLGWMIPVEEEESKAESEAYEVDLDE